MHFKKNEIVLFLEMYPIAKSKQNELAYLLYGNKNDFTLELEYKFYNHIVLTVNKWLNLLDPDEIEIIELRYFKENSLENIAAKLGYSNHSSVIYKLTIILKKIEIGGDKN